MQHIFIEIGSPHYFLPLPPNVSDKVAEKTTINKDEEIVPGFT